MTSKPLTYNQVRWAIHETQSMTKASEHLHVSYNTFKKYAVLYDLFEPNQCGRGIKKPKTNVKFRQSDPSLFWRSDKELNDFKKLLVKGIRP